jgi:hypothetical protein
MCSKNGQKRDHQHAMQSCPGISVVARRWCPLAGIGDNAAFNAITAAGWSAFVEGCEGSLSDEKVLAKVRELVLLEMQRLMTSCDFIYISPLLG